VPLLELLFFAVDRTASTHRAKVMRVEFIPPQLVSEPRYWVRSEQVLAILNECKIAESLIELRIGKGKTTYRDQSVGSWKIHGSLTSKGRNGAQ